MGKSHYNQMAEVDMTLETRFNCRSEVKSREFKLVIIVDGKSMTKMH